MNEGEQKKTVLLVDDAPANIQIVNSILKDIYKIRIATSGAKALELVKVAPPPDLIRFRDPQPLLPRSLRNRHSRSDP